MNPVVARFFRWLLPCAAGLALVLPLTASAAEPSAPSPSTPQSPPGWLADRRPKQEKLLADLGANRWHTAGFRGHDVKVLVLDTGFRGWRDQLGKVLPAQVTAHSFRTDNNLETRDQHGIL